MTSRVSVIPSEVEEPAVWPAWAKSRFLDYAGSSAFADDPAALEMTVGMRGAASLAMTMGMRVRLRLQ